MREKDILLDIIKSKKAETSTEHSKNVLDQSIPITLYDFNLTQTSVDIPLQLCEYLFTKQKVNQAI